MCWSLSYLLVGELLVIHKWSKWLDGEMERQNKQKEQRTGGALVVVVSRGPTLCCHIFLCARGLAEMTAFWVWNVTKAVDMTAYIRDK